MKLTGYSLHFERIRWRIVIVVGVVVVLGGSALEMLPHPGRMEKFPSTVLWAWERPEYLRFIDVHSVGVAFLAGTVWLHGDETTVRPRLQPLLMPPKTAKIAVVRIETTTPSLSHEQRNAALAEIVKVAHLPEVAGIQIDFDATASQRSFYHDLLIDLRSKLPDFPISITALASWCEEEKWIESLPVDEAVPMLFRMGIGNRNIHAQIDTRRDFRAPICRSSLGISTDEPWSSLPGGRRVYGFDPQPWTPDAVRNTIAGVHKWN
jgi:hypothetical protein